MIQAAIPCTHFWLIKFVESNWELKTNANPLAMFNSILMAVGTFTCTYTYTLTHIHIHIYIYIINMSYTHYIFIIHTHNLPPTFVLQESDRAYCSLSNEKRI